MPTLTESERTIRRVMIASARNVDSPLLTYTELGVAAQEAGCTATYPMLVKPFRGLGAALGKISTYEHALGRPLLSALVVQSESCHPGPGFADLARTLDRVVHNPVEFWLIGHSP